MRPKVKKASPTRKPTTLRARQRDVGEIQQGTVGWEDGKDHFDLEPSGVPLLKVTLFQGHNPDTEGPNTNPTRAMGRQILVRFDPKGSDIPNDGELVIVARPAGMQEAPGAFYLMGRPMPDPKWIPNRKSGEKVHFGPNDSFYRVLNDGTHFLFAKSGDSEDAKPVFIKLGRKGFEVRHPHGTCRADELGFEMAHSSGAAVRGGTVGGMPSPLDVVNSFITLRAAMVSLEGFVNKIGPASASPDALMKSTPTLGTLTAIQSTLAALGLWATAVGVDLHALALALGIPTLTQDAPLATLGTAIGSSGGAVTAVATAGPTRTLTGG